MSQSGSIEAFNTHLQEASQKTGELLKRQAMLRRELEELTAEAEAEGFPQFAMIFRAMADQITSVPHPVGRCESTSSRRRGRPPKSVADGAAEAQ